MMTAQNFVVDHPVSPEANYDAYHWASRQCEMLCQAWGGVRDGQIQAILAESVDLNQRMRSLYYWQLRLHFPNPYE